MTQEVRTYYADSVHETRKGGLMQIPLVEGIEVPAEGLCAYIDDVTLAGQLSAVNAHNQRLYVAETSPFGFDFAGTVDAIGDDPNVIQEIVIQNVPSLPAGSPFAQYMYMADLPETQQNPAGGTVFFSPDETSAVLAGVLFHGVVDPTDPVNPLPEEDEVAMSYLYTTGIGRWSARFPYRRFELNPPKGLNLQASQKERLSVLSMTIGDY